MVQRENILGKLSNWALLFNILKCLPVLEKDRSLISQLRSQKRPPLLGTKS